MDAVPLINGTMFGKLIAVLLLVIGLILLLTWFARRSGLGNNWQRTNNTKCLSIQEIRPIDNQRRLVLIQRNNVQHLLLIGGPNDLVVENNIEDNHAKNGIKKTSDDPLERVRFREVLSSSSNSEHTRVLKPSERILSSEGEL